MGKRDDLIQKLKPIIDDSGKLEKFIIENSNLPGPRANLELAFALAEIFDNMDVLLKWAAITEDQADVDHPRSFLAFCAAVCLGKVYTTKKEGRILAVLKNLANDGRWRMREAVAFGFQHIGESDFDEIKSLFSEWIKKSNNLEKRAILVSLAHPQFLDEERAKFCFEITRDVFEQMGEDNNFDVLQKGMNFTISVFVAVNPNLGFRFLKEWIGKDKLIDKIIKENLKKNRLVKNYPKEVKNLLNQI